MDYPMNSRFTVASNGNEFLVEDRRTGKTVSRHPTWAAALKARRAASEKAMQEKQAWSGKTKCTSGENTA